MESRSEYLLLVHLDAANVNILGVVYPAELLLGLNLKSSHNALLPITPN